MKKIKGFTLIELLVVIAIIGILAMIIIANFSSARAISRDTKRKADLSSIKTAVESYANTNAIYTIKFKNGTMSGSNSCGWFNYDYDAQAGDQSIGAALVDQGLLNPAPKDPMSKTPYNGPYDYMYYTDGNYYSIYARLEKPDCTPPCWDSTSSAGAYNNPRDINWMSYRVGNGY